MTIDQQAILDLVILAFCFGMMVLWLALTESRRTRRMERKLWESYIKLSMRGDQKFVSWEQYRQENLPGHG